MFPEFYNHYSGVIMGTMASQITSLTIVYSTVYSGADQRKHQSSSSLAFVRGIHWWPVKVPVTRKIIMCWGPNKQRSGYTFNARPVPVGPMLTKFYNGIHYNGHNGVSNHQPHHCLLNRLFRCRSKKISQLRVTDLCAGNSPVTCELWPVTQKMFSSDDVIMNELMKGMGK